MDQPNSGKIINRDVWLFQMRISSNQMNDYSEIRIFVNINIW